MKYESLKLTIVIPAYNEERYLAACLNSIKNQTILPFSVIVVDNNSKDKTSEIAGKYDYVQIIKEKHQGVVFARNVGFNNVKTELIGRIDADTVLNNDWVENALDYFSSNRDVSAITGKTYFYDSYFKKLSQLTHYFVYFYIQSKIARTNIMWGSNMVIKTSAWKEVKDHCDISNQVHEDIDLSLCLNDAGKKMDKVDSLEASASLRRGKFSFGETRKYLKIWPNSYFKHQLYIQGLLIYIVVIIILLMGLPLFLWHFLFRK